MADEQLSPNPAAARWSGLGPYYAMFPTSFAYEIVHKYSAPGDWILDPFAGRGSSIFAASTSERFGYGIEINPVGWLYSEVKLHPASENRVLRRLKSLYITSRSVEDSELNMLPEFFRYCYSQSVLRFLLECRRQLNWRESRVDATLMAILLVYLHGKSGSALSNQMRQSKSMSPQYSVQWWKARGFTPPEIDPVAFLESRIRWRYAKGCPNSRKSRVLLGDATTKLNVMTRYFKQTAGFNLLFTSPPYFGVTNYYYDQWLRLWLLGDKDHPAYNRSVHQRKFESRQSYSTLLKSVFGQAKKLLAPKAVLYIRTDMRPFTLSITIEILRELFPHKSMYQMARPLTKPSQTALFGDLGRKPGEVDILLE